MKQKRIVCFTFITMCILCSGCTSMILGDLKTENAGLRSPYMGTPENSVLIYGRFDGPTGAAISLEYFQANTECEANNQYTFGRKNVHLLLPVEPGSRYKLYSLTFTYSNGYRTYTETYNFGVQGSTELDFAVPQTPGLYFYGTHKIGSAGEKIHTKHSNTTKEELAAVKVALMYYKDTAWEAPLKARMEELSREK